MVCVTVFFLTSTPIKSTQKMNDSVVKIETEFGYGSGVIIGKEKQEEKFLYYVLTAFHLINGQIPEEDKLSSQEIPFLLTSYNDKEEVVGVNNGTFFSSDEKLDVMVITFLSTRDFAVTKISTNYELIKEVYSCTCQLSEFPSVTKGIISRLAGHFIISDAQISPGSSGGGLFVKYGDEYCLIGVAVQVAIRGEYIFFHCSYYVSSKSFIRFLKDNKIPIVVQN
jgi:S1-C subfamily serine protease